MSLASLASIFDIDEMRCRTVITCTCRAGHRKSPKSRHTSNLDLQMMLGCSSPVEYIASPSFASGLVYVRNSIYSVTESGIQWLHIEYCRNQYTIVSTLSLYENVADRSSAAPLRTTMWIRSAEHLRVDKIGLTGRDWSMLWLHPMRHRKAWSVGMTVKRNTEHAMFVGHQ